MGIIIFLLLVIIVILTGGWALVPFILVLPAIFKWLVALVVASVATFLIMLVWELYKAFSGTPQPHRPKVNEPGTMKSELFLKSNGQKDA